MVLSMSNTFVQEAVAQKANFEESELQKIMLNKLNRMGISQNEVSITDEGNIELSGVPGGLKLHNLMLQMENLGLNLKMTNKTVLEVF